MLSFSRWCRRPIIKGESQLLLKRCKTVQLYFDHFTARNLSSLTVLTCFPHSHHRLPLSLLTSSIPLRVDESMMSRCASKKSRIKRPTWSYTNTIARSMNAHLKLNTCSNAMHKHKWTNSNTQLFMYKKNWRYAGVLSLSNVTQSVWSDTYLLQ